MKALFALLQCNVVCFITWVVSCISISTGFYINSLPHSILVPSYYFEIVSSWMLVALFEGIFCSSFCLRVHTRWKVLLLYYLLLCMVCSYEALFPRSLSVLVFISCILFRGNPFKHRMFADVLFNLSPSSFYTRILSTMVLILFHHGSGLSGCIALLFVLFWFWLWLVSLNLHLMTFFVVNTNIFYTSGGYCHILEYLSRQ